MGQDKREREDVEIYNECMGDLADKLDDDESLDKWLSSFAEPIRRLGVNGARHLMVALARYGAKRDK